jgi:hypothetical protein
MHNYDLGGKDLSLTIADGDVKGKPVPGTAYSTHVLNLSDLIEANPWVTDRNFAIPDNY